MKPYFSVDSAGPPLPYALGEIGGLLQVLDYRIALHIQWGGLYGLPKCGKSASERHSPQDGESEFVVLAPQHTSGPVGHNGEESS